jgi:RNA polymerase sigma-70 factor (ECF subfamily)
MWPDSNETEQLLQQAAGGDPAAVNRLLERHRVSLRQMVRMRLDRALARRVDASDVVQDVLFEASRRLEDYIQEAKLPFHLWLRQLAKDRVIDMHRRHRTAQRRSVDREQPLAAPQFADRSSFDLAAQLKDPELTPAAANIRRELEHRFLEAIDELEEEDREVILMRHCEHLGNSEVAAVLAISPAAAGMRYLRALRRLRGVLGEPPSIG